MGAEESKTGPRRGAEVLETVSAVEGANSAAVRSQGETAVSTPEGTRAAAAAKEGEEDEDEGQEGLVVPSLFMAEEFAGIVVFGDPFADGFGQASLNGEE